MVTATVQSILDWGRVHIPDVKRHNKRVVDLDIGKTSEPTARETFYIKHTAVGSVSLYVDPYTYSHTASLLAAAATDKVYVYNATLQSCTFPATSDPSIRPGQFKAVLATYSYTEPKPYMFSDNELAEMLTLAISYLYNVHDISYTYTGTISTLVVSFSSSADKEILSRALAVIARKRFVSEQMEHGLGIAFRGPLAHIDSKTQLLEYRKATALLEASIEQQADEARLSGAGTGGVIDTQSETVVQVSTG